MHYRFRTEPLFRTLPRVHLWTTHSSSTRPHHRSQSARPPSPMVSIHRGVGPTRHSGDCKYKRISKSNAPTHPRVRTNARANTANAFTSTRTSAHWRTHKSALTSSTRAHARTHTCVHTPSTNFPEFDTSAARGGDLHTLSWRGGVIETTAAALGLQKLGASGLDCGPVVSTLRTLSLVKHSGVWLCSVRLVAVALNE